MGVHISSIYRRVVSNPDDLALTAGKYGSAGECHGVNPLIQRHG